MNGIRSVSAQSAEHGAVGSYMVLLNTARPLAEAQAALQARHSFDWTDGYWTIIKASPDDLKTLYAQGIVQYAEPAPTYQEAALPQDYLLASEKAYYPLTHQPQANMLLDGGCRPVVVAVVDSGIYPEDAEAYNTVPQSAWLNAANRQLGNADPLSRTELHGTSIAQIISRIGNNGLAGNSLTGNNVKVLPIQAKASSSFNSEDIFRAIDYAVGLPVKLANGRMVTNPYPAQVVNLSLGIMGLTEDKLQYFDTRLRDKVNDLNVILVAVAGNNGVNNEVANFARSDYTIGVGSVDWSGKRSSFSNQGPGLNTMAPGERLEIVLASGEVWVTSGTSQATAWVSAQVGALLYKEQNKLGNGYWKTMN